MKTIPDPIFEKQLPKISWKKIYEREYGVQYSELAVSLLANAKYHFPKTSVAQVVVPGEESNTAFYIDGTSWVELVEGLNKKYIANVKRLKEYERQFLYDGGNYLKITKKISKLDLRSVINKELLSIFLDHQDKRSRYSVFAWSAFILNNYVADRATAILEHYIKRHRRENEKQEIVDALFRPEKRAAVLELQYEVERRNGKLTKKEFEDLYERFKWLSCLDIHNKPWTKDEFRDHIKSFTKAPSVQEQISFNKVVDELKPSAKDLEHLVMAKRFVYIKDARDDYRRESVFYAGNLYRELARRMEILPEDVSFLQEREVIAFLAGKSVVLKEATLQRKKGFAVYLDRNKNLVCLQGDQIRTAVQLFHLLPKEKEIENIVGRVASQGVARGSVVIVKGIKDLNKVKEGDILVAITTHPDYVPAMRRASAIVTAEGGVTSHAAIVSREFGLPCIVGVKNVTSLLQDGDRVKVDATIGRIQILQ